MYVCTERKILPLDHNTCWERGGHAVDSCLALLGQGLLSHGLHCQLQVVQKLSILTDVCDRAANVQARRVLQSLL